jgi:hypothetical protein
VENSKTNREEPLLASPTILHSASSPLFLLPAPFPPFPSTKHFAVNLSILVTPQKSKCFNFGILETTYNR